MSAQLPDESLDLGGFLGAGSEFQVLLIGSFDACALLHWQSARRAPQASKTQPGG
jgi:hypothetical protein